MSTTTLETTAKRLPSSVAPVQPTTYLTTWLSQFEEKTAQDFERRTRLEYKQTIQQMIAAANPHPGMRVLDAATGSGIMARQFVGRVGDHGKIIATDTAERLEQARLAALSAQVGTKIEWRESAPDKLNFEHDSFDLVTCAMSFHRLPAQSFLAAAYRVLKTGGRLLIADELAPTQPSAWRTALRRAYYQYLVRDRIEANAQFYPAEQLVEMLHVAGFRQQIINVLRQRNPHNWAFALIVAVK